jgi:sugar phosphate isomerase/epimerase
MITTRKNTVLLALLAALIWHWPDACAQAAETPALTNEFGAFTLGMDEYEPAYLVGLMQGLGYQGLMAHTWGNDPLARLRAYTEVAAIRRGEFRVYAILWTPDVSDNLDTNWLASVIDCAGKLHASLWVAVGGTTNDLPQVQDKLARVADQCAVSGVDLVLYPHFGNAFDTVEATLPLLRRLNRTNVKLSIHLCHEMRAGNENRWDEIIASAAPYLALASINGTDPGETIRRDRPDDWSHAILPLDKGTYDVRDYLRALRRHGYLGPILLHTFGIKDPPKDQLARSLRQWRRIQNQLNQE